MATQFKQKCFKCKKNYVLVSRSQKYVICYDCQKKELDVEIKNPAMKKLFDIPEEFYKENAFLRSVKMNFIRFDGLSERQTEAFNKTVDDMKKAKENKKPNHIKD